MTSTHTRLFRSSLIAVSLVLLGTAPSLGRSMPVPCSAFARNADGGWRVLAPVMLYIGARPLGPMVGSTLPAGSMPNGVNVSEVLDQECGKAAIWRVANGAGKR
jgi:hypothetical protein